MIPLRPDSPNIFLRSEGTQQIHRCAFNEEKREERRPLSSIRAAARGPASYELSVRGVGSVLVDLDHQQNREKKGQSHPVRLGNGRNKPIHDCRDREANLSPLDTALGLQCL